MSEFDEFAEALFGQLTVEINEEKEISHLAQKASEDLQNKIKFSGIEEIAQEVFPSLKQNVEEFLGIKISDVKMEFPELKELKKVKGSRPKGGAWPR